MSGFLRFTAIAFLVGVAAVANAQQDPPFRRAEPGAGGAPEQGVAKRTGYRPVEIEDRFFKTGDWTFYHSVEDLPADLRKAVQRTLGSDVVGPGAPLDLSDAVRYPGRVQLFYVAVTADLGVVVWHSTGAEIMLHVLIYDRRVPDACEYNFGKNNNAVLPLSPTVRALIQYQGASQRGCTYRAPTFFN